MLSSFKRMILLNSEKYIANNDEVQLNCNDMQILANSYYFKYGIKIIVSSKSESPINFDEIKSLQTSQNNDDYVAYINTFGASGTNQTHFEIYIISKEEVIRPIFYTGHDFAFLKLGARTEFASSMTKDLHPQASRVECGALGLQYIKILLKDNAKLLKDSTFSFETPNTRIIGGQEFTMGINKHIILPPQVLKYSQSSRFMEFTKLLISSRTEFSFEGKDYKPVITQLTDTEQRAEFVTFQTNWLMNYDITVNRRHKMDCSSHHKNLYLTARARFLYNLARDIKVQEVDIIEHFAEKRESSKTIDM